MQSAPSSLLPPPPAPPWVKEEGGKRNRVGTGSICAFYSHSGEHEDIMWGKIELDKSRKPQRYSVIVASKVASEESIQRLPKGSGGLKQQSGTSTSDL